jgi:hypothetical protein
MTLTLFFYFDFHYGGLRRWLPQWRSGRQRGRQGQGMGLFWEACDEWIQRFAPTTGHGGACGGRLLRWIRRVAATGVLEADGDGSRGQRRVGLVPLPCFDSDCAMSTFFVFRGANPRCALPCVSYYIVMRDVVSKTRPQCVSFLVTACLH